MQRKQRDSVSRRVSDVSIDMKQMTKIKNDLTHLTAASASAMFTGQHKQFQPKRYSVGSVGRSPSPAEEFIHHVLGDEFTSLNGVEEESKIEDWASGFAAPDRAQRLSISSPSPLVSSLAKIGKSPVLTAPQSSFSIPEGFAPGSVDTASVRAFEPARFAGVAGPPTELQFVQSPVLAREGKRVVNPQPFKGVAATSMTNVSALTLSTAAVAPRPNTAEPLDSIAAKDCTISSRSGKLRRVSDIDAGTSESTRCVMRL